jgi:hypothetical protein
MIDILQEHNWPLEGFILNLPFTDYKSFDFNLEKIAGGNVNFTLERLNRLNLTLFQIMKAGISESSNSFTKLAQNDALITRAPHYIMNAPPALG